MTAAFNPLLDTERFAKAPDPCVVVIFGATGDLTARKLVPALYNLASEGELPIHFACVGFARRDKTHGIFREEMKEAVAQFSRSKPIDEELWRTFSDQLFYHQSEFESDEGYEALGRLLKNLDNEFGTNGNRVFYLSTQPSYFPGILQKLHQHGLIYDSKKTNGSWSRVIIEKPFGHDYKSAEHLQQEIIRYLDESQIYRIDHYLGKETVQNLLVFRFSNPLFEAVWNHTNIDHVEITVAEDIGIGTRGKFFEEAGILRDIVQNHMMQLLSLMAMEPPKSFGPNAIRDEKVKVLEAIRPFPIDNFDEAIVRGQYGPGFINGSLVKGYREEGNVNPQSNVETFAAMKLYIDNQRWQGVPFYLRAGKRLPKRTTEIAITFKTPHADLFATPVDSNILVIRIQPDEGISLKINCKVPGLNGPVQPVKMVFPYTSYFGATPPDAYERLICDCMSGDSTLFARVDEVMASWKLFTPVLDAWQAVAPTSSFPNYPAGMWGPASADALLDGIGHKWRLI